MKRQIIAIGGGSFASNPDNPLLERYIVAQTRKKKPRVCFLGTATGDADIYLTKFYAAFIKLGCVPTHVPLFARTPDLEKVLLSQDVIYVGGGNTKSMLAVWDDWDIPALLRKAWKQGTVLAGVSAGSICWFQHGVTDSWADHLALLPCLGFLSGTCCPHFDSEVQRRPAVHHFVANGDVPSTLAIDDGAAAHFVDGTLLRVVAAKPKAAGYMVRRVRGAAVETKLPVVFLSKTGKPLAAPARARK